MRHLTRAATVLGVALAAAAGCTASPPPPVVMVTEADGDVAVLPRSSPSVATVPTSSAAVSPTPSPSSPPPPAAPPPASAPTPAPDAPQTRPTPIPDDPAAIGVALGVDGLIELIESDPDAVGRRAGDAVEEARRVLEGRKDSLERAVERIRRWADRDELDGEVAVALIAALEADAPPASRDDDDD